MVRGLGGSRFVELLPLEDGLGRESYVEMRRIERWSVRMPRAEIAGPAWEAGRARGGPVEEP